MLPNKTDLLKYVEDITDAAIKKQADEWLNDVRHALLYWESRKINNQPRNESNQ